MTHSTLKGFGNPSENGQINYPRSFSRLFARVNDQEKFYFHLFDHLDPTQTDVTGVHLKLVDLFDSYLTTNYDSPIEVAYRNQHNSELMKHYFSPHGLHNLKNCVVYLHGHKDINFCVIKEEDYNYFYPSISNKPGFPILENFLKEVFYKRSVIFVGFSFDDHYIEDFLRYLYSLKPFPNTHYWLIDESADSYRDIINKVSELTKLGKNVEASAKKTTFYDGQLNIKPIVYKKGSHIFVQRLFDKLIDTTPVAMTPGVISGIPKG